MENFLLPMGHDPIPKNIKRNYCNCSIIICNFGISGGSKDDGAGNGRN